mgnify:CR=1 FL=1|jgi:hypothetical protein
MQVEIAMKSNGITKTISADVDYLEDWLYLLSEATRSEWTSVESIAAERSDGRMVWSCEADDLWE